MEAKGTQEAVPEKESIIPSVHAAEMVWRTKIKVFSHGQSLCFGKQNHSPSRCRWQSARKAGALIHQMMEDMKFSCEEREACGVTLRDPRQMPVKYTYTAEESFQLFPLRMHTHITPALAGLQNPSYNILLGSSGDLIGKHGQVLQKYSDTFLKLLNKSVVHEKFAK